MRSKFSIGGHPIHPMLVGLPIGLFVWAFVADLVYLGTDDLTWYYISFWTGIAAIVTALMAALPGFGDYATMAVHSRAMGIATLHMLLNLGIVGLFLAAAVLQIGEGAVAGARLSAVVVLHAVGVGALALSGWLGGQMVYRHHLGVVPENEEVARAEEARHVRPGHEPTR
jgi:uncharacterized membrane protein